MTELISMGKTNLICKRWFLPALLNREPWMVSQRLKPKLSQSATRESKRCWRDLGRFIWLFSHHRQPISKIPGGFGITIDRLCNRRVQPCIIVDRRICPGAVAPFQAEALLSRSAHFCLKSLVWGEISGKCWIRSLIMTQQNLDSALEQEIPVRWDYPHINVSLFLITSWPKLSTSSVTLLLEWRSIGHIVIDTSNEAEPFALATSESTKWTARWSAHCRHLGWQLGVLSAFYILIFVLVVNISLLIVGGVKHGGYTDGIGTLNHGDSGPMMKFLLTSSNYCMQILSAPSREELDLAHARNTWLNIGIISFRNLAFINWRRMIFWCILGLSSLPLHLL